MGSLFPAVVSRLGPIELGAQVIKSLQDYRYLGFKLPRKLDGPGLKGTMALMPAIDYWQLAVDVSSAILAERLD